MSESKEWLCSRWDHIQGSLFPWLREEVDELTAKHEQIVLVLDMLDLETHIPPPPGGRGRQPKDRRAIARAFVAKAVLNLPSTAALLERLDADGRLRRICGWERRRQVPSEATFSRAFAEFAASALPDTIHAALVEVGHGDRLVGHIARDSTEIEGREKPAPKKKPAKRTKRGRPKKGETVENRRSDRLKRQPNLDLSAMIADLPTRCDVGSKRNSKGFKHSWIGYKLHLDVADGDIPVAAILTSASLHDSQVAIPLITMTSRRVDYLYDVMDSAYEATAIDAYSRHFGHQPLIAASDRHDPGCRAKHASERKRLTRLGFETPEDRHFRYRIGAERVAGRLKDDFGACCVRVRGHAKVFCHLGFGILALTAQSLLRLVATSPEPA
ncbi:MAG: transposase [Gammaproteobacteria bacterium]|nr:transposase [Gammaproteobacteria bacterium]